MMLNQPLAGFALLCHARSRRTNLVLRLKVDPLRFKRAMIDASVDIQLGKTTVDVLAPRFAPMLE